MQKGKLQKIREAFTWGCNTKEACNYAHVTPTELKKYLQKNPKFEKEKENLQGIARVLLKKRLFEVINEAKPETCLKMIEKQEQKNDLEINFEDILNLEKLLKNT